jgi:DnaA family protein
MQQLALALSPRPEASFSNFVPGRNVEVLAVLRQLARGGAERFVYMWGAPGSGRSHLLASIRSEAAAAGRRVVHVEGRAPSAQWASVSADDVVTVAGVERLDGAGQEALFGVYNRLREGAGALVASADAPPRALALRADVATRLAWGLVYELHALNDDEKLCAMRARARALGFDLPDEVCGYILRHGRRDLPSLLGLVDLLDRRSLQAQRTITLPLVREVLDCAGSEHAGVDQGNGPVR